MISVECCTLKPLNSHTHTSGRLERIKARAQESTSLISSSVATIGFECIRAAELKARQDQKRKEVFFLLLGLEILKDHGFD
jgi:hypothetical protein